MSFDLTGEAVEFDLEFPSIKLANILTGDIADAILKLSSFFGSSEPPAWQSCSRNRERPH